MAEDKQWEIKVSVPMRLPVEQRQELFAAVVGPVEGWEPAPAERDDWDADVAGCPADEWPEIVAERSSRQAWAEELAQDRDEAIAQMWQRFVHEQDLRRAADLEIERLRREVEFEANAIDLSDDSARRAGVTSDDIKLSYFHAPDQPVNDGPRGVRITHIATGVQVESCSWRGQLRNKAAALRELNERLGFTRRVCPCVPDSEAAALVEAGFTRPQCTVQPDGGAQ